MCYTIYKYTHTLYYILTIRLNMCLSQDFIYRLLYVSFQVIVSTFTYM